MKKKANHTKGSLDDRKPLFSMVKLIGQALSNSERGKLQAMKITSWISETYPYYRSRNATRLYRSVRKALSACRFYVWEGRRHDRHWFIVPKFDNVVRKTAFIPQTINKWTGKLKRVNLEIQARKVESESNTIYLQRDDVSTKDVLHDHVSEKSLPTPKIRMPRSQGDAVVKQEDARNDASTFTMKEERDVIDLEKKPSSRSTEAFEIPREIKFRPKNMKNDSIIIDLTEDTDVICPVCGKKFINNEKLGRHAMSHKRSTPSVDITRMKETFQDLASTVFGSDKNVPICVFTGK